MDLPRRSHNSDMAGNVYWWVRGANSSKYCVLVWTSLQAPLRLSMSIHNIENIVTKHHSRQRKIVSRGPLSRWGTNNHKNTNAQSSHACTHLQLQQGAWMLNADLCADQ